MQLVVVGACLLIVACGSGEPDRPNGPNGNDGGAGLALIEVTPKPGTSAWLHEPVRFRFDGEVDGASVAAAKPVATLDGVAVGASLASEGDTITLTIDPAAEGVGTLAVTIEGEIRGPTGTASGALEATYDLAPWNAAPGEPGVAGPRLALDDHGLVAAWRVGDAGARRVVVQRLAGTWTALGEALGEDASSVALAIDGAGAPVVAWIDGGVAHVARWANGWREVASPGMGSAVALAARPSGEVIAAVFGARAVAATLVGDDWQAIGDAVTIGAFVGAPALAVGDRVAMGWIAGGQVHVVRFDQAWTALAPIALATPPHGIDRMSLAARGETIAVAWDVWAGSFGVLAARAVGDATSWTMLGRALDVEAARDAVAPAIAIDAAGAPVVAWTEDRDDGARGVVARWDDRWRIVGPSLGATAAVDLVIAGGAPVVGWQGAGGIAVARYNGPARDDRTRGSMAGCTISATAPPALLSQTGCFAIGAGLPEPHAGLVPYAVVNELWSDRAHKRRWIGMPDGAAAMTVSSTGAWTPPVGTIMVKEFALDLAPGQPASRRPVETRFLVRDAVLGWQGFSYRWREDGRDAALQPDEAQTVAWTLEDGSTVPHVYPSRSHCVSCHEGSYGPMLGLRTSQLQRWVEDGDVIVDQIPRLARLGVGPAASDPPLSSPYDPSQSIEQRMRGYMAANCAHCHNPDHIAIKDLRFATPLADTRLCEAVVPGDPARSVVYQKVSSRPGMPALGTALVDPLAVELVGAWIAQLRSCP